MAPKKCYYGDCRSDTRLLKGANLKFYRYPNPQKQPIKFEQWLRASGWDLTSSEKFVYSKSPRYICSKHFLGSDGPSKLNPNPVQLNGKVVIWNDHRKVVTKDYIGTIPVIINQTSSTSSNDNQSLSNDNQSLDIINVDPEIDNSNTKKRPNISTAVSLKRSDTCQEESNIIKKSKQTHDFSKPVSSPCSQNVELFSIDLLNKKFGCPPNWTTYYDIDNAKYSKAKGEVLALSYYIYKDKTTHLTILGKEVPFSNFIVEEIKTKIEDITDIAKNLEYLQKICVCPGNSKGDFPNIAFGSGIYNHLSDSLHSKECLLVFHKDGRVQRCTNCKKFRNVLRKLVSRNKANKEIKKRLSAMTKKQLISSVKKGKRREMYFSKQTKLLRLKYRKMIREEGHVISKKDSDIFEKIVQTNMNTTQDFSQAFLKQQLSAIKVTNSIARRWHPSIIKWCLLIHSKSPSAYECLRKTKALTLPCQRTLYNYALPLTAKPGFQAESFTILKNQMEELKCFDEEHTKYVSILIDEMKIKEELVYKRTTGDLVGFVDMGESLNEVRRVRDANDEKKRNNIDLATNVLQIMIKGITTKLQFSLAFFPCSGLHADDLNALIWEAIERLEAIDCRVLSIIGDGANTNRSFFKNNMVTPDNNCFSHYGHNYFAMEQNPRPLFFLFDNPHLLKTSRNNMECSTLNKKTQIKRRRKSLCKKPPTKPKVEVPTRLLMKNKKFILWDHIRKVYNNDAKRIPRLYPKLRLSHINLKSRGKMRVKYAVQVLSNKVATGIRKEVGEEGNESAKFCAMMNKYFDIMNVSSFSKSCYKRNTNLKPYESPDDSRLTWLENDFLGYFKEWEDEVVALDGYTNAQRKSMLLSVETSEGLKITTWSMIKIIKYMLSKGAKYILTRKLNQDPIEQEFGKHRSLCGSNTNPTVNQYSQNVGKLRLLKGIVPNAVGGNTSTEIQDSN